MTSPNACTARARRRARTLLRGPAASHADPGARFVALESRNHILLADEPAWAGFPNALVTMWTWVTEDRTARNRVLHDVLAPLFNRYPDELRDQVCIGSAEYCAELLSHYARAGCQRVYLWPLGDERRQLELVAAQVAPRMEH